MEAPGLKTEASSHLLEGRGHGEAIWGTDTHRLLDSTQSRAFFLQKGN